MDRHEEEQKAEVAAHLRSLHERLLNAVKAAHPIRNECPSIPRIRSGGLLPREKSHVAQCPKCRQASRKRNPWRSRGVWIGTIAAAALLLLFLARELSPTEIHHHRTTLEAASAPPGPQPSLLAILGESRLVKISRLWLDLDSRAGMLNNPNLAAKRLSLAQTVGSRAFDKLESADYQLSKRVAPPTRLEFGDIQAELARIVSPKMLAKLTTIDQSSNRKLSPALLIQFGAARLEAAKLISPPMLLKVERQKSLALAKLPPAVVLDLYRTNLATAKICGQRTFESLFNREVQSAGRLDNATLIDLAHRYNKMANDSRISGPRLRSLADDDYKSANEASLADKKSNKQ
jgi:hypothetical protein